ncbi:hypothetical protein AoKodu_11750 [Actinomyces oris K20]|uniref:hypothetical protein n=2 Tax=Actinomyces oris TaxID=544580 RepID=UPI002067C26D|nr:hypothetical protein [Actinomyces oris]BDF98874.1 hypothetical protein AoKodu_11750 [Actinomyces oris K20]
MTQPNRDVFVDIGVSLVKLLLYSQGLGSAATGVGEGARLIKGIDRLRHKLDMGWQKDQLINRISQDISDNCSSEHRNISEQDWRAAAQQVATLIGRLSEKDRVSAGYKWAELRRNLLKAGGNKLRNDIGDDSATQAFDVLLEVTCQHITKYFTNDEAAAATLDRLDNIDSNVLELLNRHQNVEETHVTVGYHFASIREFAPAPLDGREHELNELNNFIFSSDDSWYVIEGKIACGKTALLANFVLNPPPNTHVVSYFISRNKYNNNYNDFVKCVYAQLSQIFGYEYTITADIDKVTFESLLTRTARVCRSEKIAKPLVIVIDGIDEDSYHEHPGEANAKPILSLLPTSLPEGVKLVTSSRPGKKYMRGVLPDVPRKLVTLTASPSAAKYIDTDEIERFFKTELSVHIGAFIAASNGALTVQDLRHLISMKPSGSHVTSRTIKNSIDGCPGRMLISKNIGFGNNEVLAYRLGHDVVLRAILKELAPDNFGEGNEPDDDEWWAELRRKELDPYRKHIKQWIRNRVKNGWNDKIPGFVLTDACSDLFLNDEEIEASLVLNRERYKELLDRGAQRFQVLSLINRDSYKMLSLKYHQITKDDLNSLRHVVDFKESLLSTVECFPHACALFVSHFRATTDEILNHTKAIPDVRQRLTTVEKVMEAAVDSGRYKEFISFYSSIVDELLQHTDAQDSVYKTLIHVYAGVAFIWGEPHNIALVRSTLTSLTESLDTQAYRHPELSHFLLSPISREKLLVDIVVDVVGQLMHMTEHIKSPTERLQALNKLCLALVAYIGIEEYADHNRFRQLVVNLNESTAKTKQQVSSYLSDMYKTDCLAVDCVHPASSNQRCCINVTPDYYSNDSHYFMMRMWESRKELSSSEEMCLNRPDESWGMRRKVQFLMQKTVGLVREGDFREARKFALDAKSFFDSIGNSEDRLLVMNNVSTALTMVGYFQEALDVATDPYEKSITLKRIVEMLVRKKNFGEARKFALDAKSFFDSIGNSEDRLLVMNNVSTALTMVGYFQEALDVATDPYEKSQIATGAPSDDDYFFLIGVILGLLDLKEFCRADKVAMRIFDPEDVSLVSLYKVRRLKEHGDVDQARCVAKEMMDVVGDSADSRLLSDAVSALIEVKEFDLALDLTDDPVNKARVLTSKVNMLADKGDYKTARCVAKEMMDVVGDSADSQLLSDAVSALIEVKEFDLALDLTDDPVNKARVLTSKVNMLANYGEDEMVRQVMEDVRRLVGDIDCGEYRVRAEVLGCIIVELRRVLGSKEVAPFVEDALTLANSIGKDNVTPPGARLSGGWDVDGKRGLDEDRCLFYLFRDLMDAGCIDEAERVAGYVSDLRYSIKCQILLIAPKLNVECCEERVSEEVSNLFKRIGVSGFGDEVASAYGDLAEMCCDVAGRASIGCDMRNRLLGMARSGIAHSWLYGASVWDSFDVLMRVAPELAVRLVDERILADPEQGAGPESEASRGPEGPGGDAGSYR